MTDELDYTSGWWVTSVLLKVEVFLATDDYCKGWNERSWKFGVLLLIWEF